jgi:hydrogenase maturation protein HypF
MFATMAEHGLQNNIIAVVMDGTGYGEDGAIWGGEFFSYLDSRITREAHIGYVSQPAGDASVKNPCRMAQAWLMAADVWSPYWAERMHMTAELASLNGNMIAHNISTLPTSSAGRLFEAVGAMLLGIGANEYEAHAAVALEAIANTALSESAIYPYCFDGENIDMTATIAAVAKDIQTGIANNIIAARFHNTMADMICKKTLALCEFYAINDVVLSGGVFQNKRLLEQLYEMLQNKDINCHIQRLVPANDGGISLGQAYWASLTKVDR